MLPKKLFQHVFVLGLLFLPGRVFAAVFQNPLKDEVTLGGIFARGVNALLAGIAIFAVGAIVFAGFTYVTSLGDEGKVGKAKKIIFYAIIGLILAILSRLVLEFVGTVLGVA